MANNYGTLNQLIHDMQDSPGNQIAVRTTMSGDEKIRMTVWPPGENFCAAVQSGSEDSKKWPYNYGIPGNENTKISWWDRTKVYSRWTSNGTERTSVTYRMYGKLGWQYADNDPVKGKQAEMRYFTWVVFTQKVRGHPLGGWKKFDKTMLVNRFRRYNPNPFQDPSVARWKLVNLKKYEWYILSVTDPDYNAKVEAYNRGEVFETGPHAGNPKYKYEVNENGIGVYYEYDWTWVQQYERDRTQPRTGLDWNYDFYLPGVMIIKRVYGREYFMQQAPGEKEYENFIGNHVYNVPGMASPTTSGYLNWWTELGLRRVFTSPGDPVPNLTNPTELLMAKSHSESGLSPTGIFFYENKDKSLTSYVIPNAYYRIFHFYQSLSLETIQGIEKAESTLNKGGSTISGLPLVSFFGQDIIRWNSMDAPDFPDHPKLITGPIAAADNRVSPSNSHVPSYYYYWNRASLAIFDGARFEKYNEYADVWMFMPDKLYERPPPQTSIDQYNSVVETMQNQNFPGLITEDLKRRPEFANLEIGDPNPMYPEYPRNEGHFRFKRKLLTRYKWKQEPIGYEDVSQNRTNFYWPGWWGGRRNEALSEPLVNGVAGTWQKFEYESPNGTELSEVKKEMISWLPFDCTSAVSPWLTTALEWISQGDNYQHWVCRFTWRPGTDWTYSGGWESYQYYPDPIGNPTYWEWRRRWTPATYTWEWREAAPMDYGFQRRTYNENDGTNSLSPQLGWRTWNGQGSRPSWLTRPDRITSGMVSEFITPGPWIQGEGWTHPITGVKIQSISNSGTIDLGGAGTPADPQTNTPADPARWTYPYWDTSVETDEFPNGRPLGPPRPIVKNARFRRWGSYNVEALASEIWWGEVLFDEVYYTIKFEFTGSETTPVDPDSMPPMPTEPTPDGWQWQWSDEWGDWILVNIEP